MSRSPSPPQQVFLVPIVGGSDHRHQEVHEPLELCTVNAETTGMEVPRGSSLSVHSSIPNPGRVPGTKCE